MLMLCDILDNQGSTSLHSLHSSTPCSLLLQARLTPEFIKKAGQKTGQSPKLTLLYPESGQIHTGQLLYFTAPDSLKMPTAISIGTRAAVLLHKVVRDSSFTQAGLSAYVTCVDLVPDGSNDCGQLISVLGRMEART